VKVSFYVYANNESDGKLLEQRLYDFVEAKRQQGIAVMSDKLISALDKFQDNFFLNQFLKR
jgi:hypothetical protein